ncbi:type VI secretion system Vgr family protein [Martelella alba]|uniref:Type VI secretion system tip protein VgrG n=1 Tax=Martelella alba TaxID=2590451 RepID=A0ABY2SDU0_9HYPH|nr:type VI secretion system Vgr family protein [Martelella alba]TKI02360.1 type VI secretion system tip protein VgrG [Martelella alba]
MLKDVTAITGDTSLSLYSLAINDSAITPDVLRFRGTERFSQPFLWRIEFTTPQRVQGDDVLLKPASFEMRGSKVVHGIITGFECLFTHADQSHYAINLESRLALLSRSRRCALYQHLSVPEMVEQILRSHGLEGADFEFTLSREYPVRELITQWRESDLEFIQRILSEVGIWFRQEINNVTQLDVTVFGDSQLHYVFNGALPYHEPSGLYDRAELCCWGLRIWHRVVTETVATRNYPPRKVPGPLDARVSVRSPAVTTGEDYRYEGPYLTAGEDAGPEPGTESGAFYARIHHERELNKSAYLHLFSNAYWLSPGAVIDLAGVELRDLEDGVVIVFVSYRGARDSRLHVSLWGMPYRMEYSFRPAVIARPKIHGTIPGRVESREKNDPYAHLDEDGRYRVRMSFNLEDGEPGFSYPWLRLMKPVAGDEHGWHMPLIDGTEVGVAFHWGDPDHPYIANTFHDAAHPDIVNRDNRSQNILRTAGDNELRMEDLRDKEHIALTTPYAASQLNQGHVTDQHGKQRGSGFELRTDEYGVIRAAKGLFITADGQTKSAGDVLDMDTALYEIALCRERIKQLAVAAKQLQAPEADIAGQISMFNRRLKSLNQMIHCHGVKGVVLCSDEHMQLAAVDNIVMNAGGHISIGSMGNVAMLAGGKVGLYTRSGKLNLISGEGPTEMKAQKGEIRLDSAQKLSIISLSDILFQGKKRITLIGGGSYLRIEEGHIEYGTTGDYLRKVKRTHLAESAAMPLDLPAFGAKPKQIVSVARGRNNAMSSAVSFKFIPEGGE